MSGQPQSAGDDESPSLFFAIWPDAEARDRLTDAAARVLPRGDSRPVAAHNYHLTVAFLGTVSRSKLSLLRQLACGQRVRKFAIRFDAYEYWPKPQVIVAAARSVPDELQQFWNALHRELEENDFILDPKRLRPHVTLARKVTQAPVLPPLSAFIWSARAFCLASSHSVGNQSVYTVLDTWPLLDTAKSI